jgi:glyoxylase-like metal-dependent hydrolase (beta-lactamase superfamily II)
VRVPDAKVVYAGDLFWCRNLPNLIDASTLPWIDTLETLVKDYANDTFVPGHGDVGTVRDVAAFRDYLKALRTLVAGAKVQGQSGDALAQTIMPALKGTYGGWAFFQEVVKENVLQTDAELTGRKRVPHVPVVP